MQFKTTQATLDELGFDNNYIKVLNKCDGLESTTHLPDDCVLISAKRNTGISQLKEAIKKSFEERFVYTTLNIPFDKMGEYEKLKRFAVELSRNFTDSGMTVEAKIERINADKFNKFMH